MESTNFLKNAVSDKKFTLSLPISVLNAIEEAHKTKTMLSYENAKAIMACLNFKAEDKEEEYYIWWKDSIFRDILPLHPDIYYKENR